MENDNPYLREVNKVIKSYTNNEMFKRDPCMRCKYYGFRQNVYKTFIESLERLKNEIRIIYSEERL